MRLVLAFLLIFGTLMIATTHTAHAIGEQVAARMEQAR